jgi:hypothetical protein
MYIYYKSICLSSASILFNIAVSKNSHFYIFNTYDLEDDGSNILFTDFKQFDFESNSVSRDLSPIQKIAIISKDLLVS